MVPPGGQHHDGGKRRLGALRRGRGAGRTAHRDARSQDDDRERPLEHDGISYLVNMTMTGPHAVRRMLPIA